MAKRGKFRQWYADRDAEVRMVTGRSARQLGAKVWQLWGKDLLGKKFMAARGPEPPGPLQEAYDILGLSPSCSEKALRKTYLFRVQEVHPDTGGNTEAFKKVDEAMDRVCEARGIRK